MPRRYRTSRSIMVLRTGLATWMVVFLGCLFLGVAPGFGLLFVVLAVIVVFMFVASIFVRIVGYVLYGDDPDYRRWVAEGGDPYFDILPPPFNEDSWAVRAGGQPEPATDFVPPSDWMFQCNGCGARNPDGAAVCWHCGAALQQRLVQCGGCGGTFLEPTYGDLETRGVRCPWCGAVMRT